LKYCYSFTKNYLFFLSKSTIFPTLIAPHLINYLKFFKNLFINFLIFINFIDFLNFKFINDGSEEAFIDLGIPYLYLKSITITNYLLNYRYYYLHYLMKNFFRFIIFFYYYSYILLYFINTLQILVFFIIFFVNLNSALSFPSKNPNHFLLICWCFFIYYYFVQQ